MPGLFWRARIASASDDVAMSGPLPVPVLPDMNEALLLLFRAACITFSFLACEPAPDDNVARRSTGFIGRSSHAF
jgi:hypothetical protein